MEESDCRVDGECLEKLSRRDPQDAAVHYGLELFEPVRCPVEDEYARRKRKDIEDPIKASMWTNLDICLDRESMEAPSTANPREKMSLVPSSSPRKKEKAMPSPMNWARERSTKIIPLWRIWTPKYACAIISRMHAKNGYKRMLRAARFLPPSFTGRCSIRFCGGRRPKPTSMEFIT